MKRLLALGAAFAANWIVSAVAADLPVAVKAPVLAVPAWEWTGCYAGVQGGGNWGRTHNNDITPPFVGVPVTNPYNLSGGLVGGTIGCQFQSWRWVFGIEADASWTNKDGIANEIAPFNTAATFAIKERWIDTLRGRLGFKFGAEDQFMVYATGGAAAAGVTATTALPGTFSVSASNTMAGGWTAGGGGEWAMFPPTPTPHGWMSVKVEYLYVDLGAKDFVFDPTVTTSKNVSVIDHIVRAGVNWHF